MNIKSMKFFIFFNIFEKCNCSIFIITITGNSGFLI